MPRTPSRRTRRAQADFFGREPGPSLADQEEALQAQLFIAEDLLAKATRAHAPFLAAIEHARWRLEALHARRREAQSKAAVSKAEMLAAYDARMHAGHAGHPTASKQADADRWVKLLRRELHIVLEARGR